ncbi:MAG: acetyl/propionyl/methylcrotonyl-CoA carboxylase subunit alpha [Pseudomonadota bacterium]
MIKTLLIANRGEIAVRIARTARQMGVRTVAIYSDVDTGAAHVAACHDAVALGGQTPAESYLRQDAVLDAARVTGADAIHPGYGFLSENPDFVEKVEAAGLTFVGPSAQAIRAMGLKDAAKKLMEEAGVPVVPGYHGSDQSDAVLRAAAEEIGYPVLIKAVAGGGGKGMRLVEASDAFDAALASARVEAKGAFGNADVLIEKYVSTPRHIELQVFGDGTRAVHLYERDCSLQRRHQKVIEEAPAPGMTDEMRAAMGQAAVRAAEAIGFAGAGTVEFIVDASDGLRADRFYFMEMNTRLQVEHPVTEAVTGVDLVEWQLRVASGEPLPMEQEEIPLCGHAFEARLYAEDAAAGFLPATGRLTRLRFSAEARADSGVREGDTISPFYDPMIAKLITHAETREAALAKLDRALSGTDVAGLVTNLGFLRRLARVPAFAAGEVDTGLIAREGATLTDNPTPCAKTQALAAIGAMGLHEARPYLSGFTLWEPLTQFARLSFGGEPIELSVKTDGAGFDVGGVRVTQQEGRWWIDGRPTAARIHRDPGQVTVFFGTPYVFDIPDPLAAGNAGAGADVIEAPMPGLLRDVMAAPGQAVKEGDPLAVFEAMKMEHTLRAPRDGVIAEVMGTAGSQTDAGAPIIRLEALEEAAP